MPELQLANCRSRPLIGYLKALGVLRTVSLQADRSARGRWRRDVFELRSELDGPQLVDFLLSDYAPSPVVSPWNGGSGFHPNDRKEAILAIEHATDPRFATYQKTIASSRAVLEHRGIVDKPDAGMKLPLVRELRRVLPDEALPWIDAAIVVTGERVSYPPLLGSGGNDGRYDFSNNYAQAIARCLISEEQTSSKPLLTAALQGGSVELQRKLSLAHLSRDSSPNNSPYGEADSLGNPWDLILAVEGILLLVAGAARRLGKVTGGALVAPFTVRSTAAGYGSAVNGETGRAELWLPLWSGWATHAEIAALARESRAQVGRRSARRQAHTGLDFARAAGQLGVARGIDAFERYAILERAGQASLAVPVGRISVSERSSAAAVQSIGRWLDRVLGFAAGDRCPQAIRIAARRLERAGFQLASRGEPGDACATLEAIGAVEHALARSHAAVDGHLRPLHSAAAKPWMEIADDGTAEFAIAVALASLRDRGHQLPALRDYIHGTRGAGASFEPERRDAVEGKSAVDLLAALHVRRHLDASRRANDHGAEQDGPRGHREASRHYYEHLRLGFELGASCPLRVARLFAAGLLDEERVLRLLRGLVLLDHDRHDRIPQASVECEIATPVYEVLALAWMGSSLQPLDKAPPKSLRPSTQALGAGKDPELLDRRESLHPRRGWATRLSMGAVEPVVRDALLRLQMAGLEPIPSQSDLLAGASSTARFGPRLCAALLLRLRPHDLQDVARRLTISHSDEENNHREGAA